MRALNFVSVLLAVVVLSLLTPGAVAAPFAAGDEPSGALETPAVTGDRGGAPASELGRSVGTDEGTAEVATDDERHRVVIFFESFAARDAPNPGGPNVTVHGGRNVDFAPVLFASVPAAAIPVVEARPDVEAVVIDGQMSLSDTATTGVAESTSTAAESEQVVPWGVERLDARTAAAQVPGDAQRNVTVAVLDTGVDYTHPNLDGNVVWGANTTNGTVEYGLEPSMDDNGHGTRVAGVLAAEDDGTGVVGVAPNVRLYSIKVLDSEGYGRESWLIAGIEAAIEGEDGQIGTDDDADVVSISLGTSTSSETLRRAIEHAQDDGATIVAAAGNTGATPAEDGVLYPGKYSDSIAVVATDRDDEATAFSASGDEVELAAPGDAIETTDLGGGTIDFTGTSAAVPHVSGVAALVIGNDSADGTNDLSNGDVRERLRGATVDIGAEGRDNESGYGLLQADAALGISEQSATLAGTVRSSEGDPVSDVTVSLYVDGSGNPISGETTSVDGTFRFEDLEPGRDYTVEATDDDAVTTATVFDIAPGTTERTLTLPADGTPSVNITATAPETVERGQQVALEYAITNVGNGTATDGSLELELPKNVTIQNETTRSLQTPLDPGETWAVNVSLDTPGPFDGKELRVDADAALGNSTTNRSTTFRLVETNVSALGPRTVTAAPGESVSITYQLRNTGTSHPSEGVVWVSSVDFPLGVAGDDTFVLDGSTAVPTPNESVSYTTEITVPNATRVGNYTVEASAMLGHDDPSQSQDGSTASVDLAVVSTTVVVAPPQASAVERYDTNGDAGIQSDELRGAFEDWKQGDLDSAGLRDVFESWKRT